MRITRVGLLKPDDPIFSGGVEMFTVRRPKPPAEKRKKKPAKEKPDEQ